MSVTTIDATLIQRWVSAKLEPRSIEEELRSKGFDADSISLHLNAYKKLRNEKKRFSGFICLATGAFLGFVSCVLTVINPIPDLYNIILFGLTSVSILIICLGLYLVFE